jgi:hypothetical protein
MIRTKKTLGQSFDLLRPGAPGREAGTGAVFEFGQYVGRHLHRDQESGSRACNSFVTATGSASLE